jgi:hypothetical protein
MSMTASPLATISEDTATLEAHLKASFATLSTDTKNALAEALADAHTEASDIEKSGSTVWAAILAAVGKK